uniref:Uncharacterized protein n=1 Tax=Moorena producens (strain JHB) TaxID=1454205 RepID=A0A1D9G4R8_MOOP1
MHPLLTVPVIRCSLFPKIQKFVPHPIKNLYITSLGIDTPRSKETGILHSTTRLAEPGRNQEQ